MSLRKTFVGTLIALGMVMGSSAFAATIVNLGFAIDHSGSMNNSYFALQKNGLAGALALIPTDNPDVQYRVGVITFGADVKTLVAPEVVTAANIGAIQSAITSHVRSNTRATATGDAINTLTAMFDDMDSTLTLFNLSTDGAANAGANWVTASSNAFAAGVNSISFELVGSFGNSQINAMLGLAGPDAVYVTNAADLPNATEQGFVFAARSFADYEAAITAKIQKIVDDTGGGIPAAAAAAVPAPVPVPASLPLLMGALGLVGSLRLRRRGA